MKIQQKQELAKLHAKTKKLKLPETLNNSLQASLASDGSVQDFQEE